MHVLKKAAVSAVAASAGCVALIAGTMPTAHALGTPSLPPGNLTSGTTINVGLTDLTAGVQYRLGVCNNDGSAASPPACDSTDGHGALFTASGSTATIPLKVRKNFVAPGHGGAPGTTVNCKGSVGTQCYVVVAQHPGGIPNKSKAVTFN